MAEETTRRSAQEIFEKVAESAHDELSRSSRALAFSGVAGGMGMGLTGLSVAVVQAALGPGSWQEFVSLLFYPMGFVAVIIGRAQLFTENTLFSGSPDTQRTQALREHAQTVDCRVPVDYWRRNAICIRVYENRSFAIRSGHASG